MAIGLGKIGHFFSEGFYLMDLLHVTCAEVDRRQWGVLPGDLGLAGGVGGGWKKAVFLSHPCTSEAER